MKLSTFPFDTQLLKVRAILYACPQRVNGRPPARRIQFQAGKSEVYPEGFIQSNAYTIDDEIILMQGRTRPLHEDCVEVG